MVTLFEDTASWFTFHISSSRLYLIEVKVGCLGIGNTMFSLSSISKTAGMFGLWAAMSCTHSIPTWMHLSTCSCKLDSGIEASSSSIALPLSQRSHALEKKTQLGPSLLKEQSRKARRLRSLFNAYICNHIWKVRWTKACISLARYDLQEQHAKAINIWLEGKQAFHCIFRCHVTAVKTRIICFC